jgi:predicted porin
MKNTLLNPRALTCAALVAAAGGACAQSSVTIYGIIDVGVARMNAGQSNLTFWPGPLIGRPDALLVRPSSSNRIGFRGSEDLGGGLRANFDFEHRLAADTGEVEPLANGFWQGTSWVGVSGPFGEVRLGRQYVPAFYIGVQSDPWGYDFNVAGVAGFTRAGNPVSRANNAVSYRTPNLSGFTSEISVAAGEGGTPVPGQGAGRNIGANLQYRGGPLWAGVGFNDLETQNAFDHRYFNVALAYDFGVVRPIVNYGRGRNGTSHNAIKTMLVGATAPLGAGRLKAVAARYDAAVGVNANGANFTGAPAPATGFLPANLGGHNTTKFGLGYEYFLSKRTSVHADVGTAKTQTFSRTTGVEAGVKHVF